MDIIQEKWKKRTNKQDISEKAFEIVTLKVLFVQKYWIIENILSFLFPMM